MVVLKRILVVVVIGLGAVGISAGYRKVSYNASRQRLREIKKPYFGAKRPVTIMFQNMIFPTGKSVAGIDPSIVDVDTCSDAELEANFTHLHDHVEWLRSLDDIGISVKVTNITLQTKGKRFRAQNFQLFGVNAVEVVDSQGRKKLWATEVMRMNEVHDGQPDKPIPYPKKQTARREDFANPGDVDWLLGVSDFSKYGVERSEVR